MYKKAEVSFWTAEEMDLSKDAHDWTNKPNDNRHRRLLWHRQQEPRQMFLQRTFSNKLQAAEAHSHLKLCATLTQSSDVVKIGQEFLIGMSNSCAFALML